jgi:hypothetical protein
MKHNFFYVVAVILYLCAISDKAISQQILPSKIVEADTSKISRINNFFKANIDIRQSFSDVCFWLYNPTINGEFKVEFSYQKQEKIYDTTLVLNSNGKIYASSSRYLVTIPKSRKKVYKRLMVELEALIKELNCTDFESLTYTGSNLSVRFCTDEARRIYHYKSTKINQLPTEGRIVVNDHIYYQVFTSAVGSLHQP